MLRLDGEADPEGKLYPSGVVDYLKLEQAMGLTGDLSRVWSPGMYVGMHLQKFGYPPKDELSDADSVIRKVRTEFITGGLPQFMGYFTDLIKESGGNYCVERA